MKLTGFVKYRLPNSKDVVDLKGVWELKDHLKGVQYSEFVISSYNGKSYFVFESDEEMHEMPIDLCYRTQDEGSYKEFGEYLNDLETIIKRIKNGDFQKIIFSRRELLNKSIDPEMLFNSLNIQYENSFNYFIGIEGEGVWIGATPEAFIKSEDFNYKMHSLAGTIARNSEGKYDWTDKEIKEQKLVTDYLIDHFEKSGIHDVSLKGPFNFEHGSVAHLKTDITLNATPDQINEMLRDVHPTPAVCGIPKGKVLEEIQEIEGYDRRFYTGLVGLYSEDQTALFVNLRCMEIFIDDACLYLGGGITEGSDPEKEWDETVLKSKTIKDLL